MLFLGYSYDTFQFSLFFGGICGTFFQRVHSRIRRRLSGLINMERWRYRCSGGRKLKNTQTFTKAFTLWAILGLTLITGCSALRFGPDTAGFTLVFPRIEGSRDISNYPGVAGWRIQGRTKTERFTQDFPLDSSTVSIKELTPGSWSIRVQGLNSDKLPIYEASRDIKLDVGDNAFTVSLNELLPSMEVFAGGQPVFSSNPVDLGDLSSSGDFQDTVITIRNNGDDPLYIAPSLDPQGSQAIQILTPLPLGPILKNDETELVLRYSYSGSGNHDSNLFLPNNDIEAVGFSLQLSGFIS
jgi:hypothetical protein